MKPNARPEVQRFVDNLLEVADKNPPKEPAAAVADEEQQVMPQRGGEDIVDFNNRRLRYIKQTDRPAEVDA